MRFCSLIVLLAVAASGAVRLPAVISDHMLLQRDLPVRIWGWADPGEEVTVAFRGETAQTKTTPLGRWQVTLKPGAAGGPFELTVRGTNTITVADVLVGEVWIGSGQSNMAWPVSRSDNAAQEIAAANHPQIRLFRVALKVSPFPLADVQGSWSVCSPDSVKDFSAVGYFFARHLNEKLKVPVGVIQTAWGGTPADAWTSAQTLAADASLISVFSDWARLTDDYADALARYEVAAREWEANGEKLKAAGRVTPRKPAEPAANPFLPGGLFNAMVAPLTPFGIRGAIWYQGENNAGKKRAFVYRRLFTTMIEDWRRAWGQGDFPFLFVQLANFGKNDPQSEWPELREAQAMALSLKNTGMAVTIDIGNPADIHPTNKQDVGVRLGLAARAIAHGEQIVYSGPLFRQAQQEGGKLRLWFDHTGGGLVARGGALTGFTVAGPDGKFVPAEAVIDGKSVVLSSPAVERPVAARYAWMESPECNLFNAEGLPASPFRTDEWTAAKQYR